MSTQGFSFLLLVSLLALDGQTSRASADPANLDSAAPRHVLWIQLCAPDLEASDLRGIEQETSSIYSAAGVELAWVERCDGRPVEATHPGSATVYILERFPKKFLNRLPRQRRDGRMLAFIPTYAGGVPGTSIYVSTKSVVARASNFGSKPLSRSLRARALGRVVAHELAHRFIQMTHTREGILKAKADRRDLTRRDLGSFFFSEQQVRHLRAVAAPWQGAVATAQGPVLQRESQEAPDDSQAFGPELQRDERVRLPERLPTERSR